MSRMKALATAVTSVMLLGMMTAPAIAFIHTTIPAGECAASEQAGDNETADEFALEHNKAQEKPIGNSQGASNPRPMMTTAT